MKILVACEESQIVTKEMRLRGHEAYSCDIMGCSGNKPEWHIKGDVLSLINGDCTFITENNMCNEIHGEWDMLIAFPPCTYLTVTGNRWFNIEKYGDKARERHRLREKAVKFFMVFANAKCDKIAIENPIGIMSTRWRKPDQIVHPYYFGDPERKSTCLWLKGLSLLQHNKEDYVKPNIIKYKNGKGTDSKWHMETMKLPSDERSKARSKTFPGIAEAMGAFWGNLE